MANKYIKIETDNITGEVPTKETIDTLLKSKASVNDDNTFTGKNIYTKDASIVLPNSKLANINGSDLKEDSWFSTDIDTALTVSNVNETSSAGLVVEKGYSSLFYTGEFGRANISISSNDIAMSSHDSENVHHSEINVTPESFKYNGKDVITASADIAFEQKPKVKVNGEATNVALVSDLNNFVATQSEKDSYYSLITNEDSQISFRVFKNGDETDTQNLVITKDSITINGKPIPTSTIEIPTWKTTAPTDTSKVQFTKITITSISDNLKELKSKIITVPEYTNKGFTNQVVAGSSGTTTVSCDGVFIGSLQLNDDNTTAAVNGTLMEVEDSTTGKISVKTVNSSLAVTLSFEYLW